MVRAAATAPSGYASRLLAAWYGIRHPFYDMVTWWGFLPLGGERAVRSQIIDWIDARPGNKVLSLCCGTGSTEMALVERVPEASVIAIDLGKGQLGRARYKDPACRIDFVMGDATRTCLPDRSFDRVIIILALHEMVRETRLAVLREAARTCKAEGRVIAVEHGTPPQRRWRIWRHLMWFYWLPGNPEYPTTMDLQRHGLAVEMAEAGMMVLERRQSKMEWIEAVVARPR